MKNIQALINSAIREDLGAGDITSTAVVPKDRQVKAKITAKEDMVVAGTYLAACVFLTIDKKIKINIKIKDGKKVKKGTVLAEIKGPAVSILSAERTALNFLQHLSGIATFTSQFVSKVKGLKVKILDTRKTIPGLRMLEKYAVKMGGGTNHRIGLFDMYLIKNNHIDIAGSITEAVRRCSDNVAAKVAKPKFGRASSAATLLEVEVRNFKELREAISAGADIIMLDNFNPKNTKKAVNLVKKLTKTTKNKPKIEISGGINLKNVKKYAKTGVNFISVGTLTHSAKSSDIHMIVS